MLKIILKSYVLVVYLCLTVFNPVVSRQAEDDKVVARLTYIGTHKGEICGIAPTGRRVSYSGMAIFRLTDNKILSGWVLNGTLRLIKQLKEA